VVRIDALGRHRTALRMSVQREHRPLEAAKPRRALLGRALDDPQVQLFELGFRVPREINAVCHACGAADRTLAAQASCDQP
jgi:hypothetical protein